MKIEKPDNLAGDLWGGLAAMLVALPSAIAYGVTIFLSLGAITRRRGHRRHSRGHRPRQITRSSGTSRLITAPCAPAAVVLSALAIQWTQNGITAESAVLMLSLMGLICGLFQVGFGAAGLGRLIKYVPYPVVSGYLSGVGLIIIMSQVPKFLGLPNQAAFWEGLVSPLLWQWQGVAVGAVTMAVMLTAPMLTKAVPAAVLGLASGIIAYFGLALADPALLVLEGNALVIGQLGGSGVGFGEAIAARWMAIEDMDVAVLGHLLVPAATLAVLLSIDTLKTCVVLDALTRSRHDSNRELVGQGLGNLAAALIGGVPGSGQTGATLINMSSGAQTRLSGLIEGALALIAFLILGTFIAWVPIPALAAILIVIGLRMFDRTSLSLLQSRATVLDFAVIVTVVVAALTVSLIAASGAGVALAIALFIREQIRSSIVRSKAYGNQMFSRRVRLPQEMAILERRGGETAIFELQGSLFFGTADQLYTTLEPEIKMRTYLILDMRRVQSVDLTAVHMLEQIEGMLAERGAYLFSASFRKMSPAARTCASTSTRSAW